MYFCYFVITSPCKRVWPFIKTNFSPLHQRMLCAKFGWYWSSGSCEENLIFNVSVLFHNYLPLKKGMTLYLNKLKSLSPKDALCQVGWNRPSGSEEEDENVKSLWWQQWPRQGRWTTVQIWLEKLTWAFGSGELKTDWVPYWWICSKQYLLAIIQNGSLKYQLFRKRSYFKRR